MKTIRVEFIVDASGSMGPQQQSVIEGFNNQLLEMKQEEEAKEGEIKYLVSLTFFSSKVVNAFDKVPIAEVKPLDESTYVIGGMTALFDAIGSRIETAEEGEEDVLVYIYTDGHENASSEYNSNTITALVDHRKNQGWGIVYFGANQDALSVASSFGINCAVTYNTSNTSEAFYSAKAIRGTYVNNTLRGSSGMTKTANLMSDVDVESLVK